MDYKAVVWYNAFRVISYEVKEKLFSMSLWEDVRQEVEFLTIECERNQFTLKETSNHAQRGIYRALKNYGFRRPKFSKGFTIEDQGVEEPTLEE